MKLYYGTINNGTDVVEFLGEILICNNPNLFEYLREKVNKERVPEMPKIEVREWKESE